MSETIIRAQNQTQSRTTTSNNMGNIPIPFIPCMSNELTQETFPLNQRTSFSATGFPNGHTLRLTGTGRHRTLPPPPPLPVRPTYRIIEWQEEPLWDVPPSGDDVLKVKNRSLNGISRYCILEEKKFVTRILLGLSLSIWTTQFEWLLMWLGPGMDWLNKNIY